MIQFYDDRPDDPIEAFIYFETVFRQQFLENASSETSFEYASRLLIAKRELELSILPDWEFRRGYSVAEFKNEMSLRFHREFDDKMLSRFQREVVSILPELRELSLRRKQPSGL